MDTFEKEYHSWMLAESVSVLPSTMVVFKENVYWRSNMSFKKETEKFVLLQVKVLIQIIFMFRTEKKFVRIFIIHH